MSAEWPVVSIVIPCRDRAESIDRAIDSALAQRYPALEVIVVDGASSDGTVEVLRRYGDRIRWISEPDAGPFDAINKGFALARGEVFAWLNDDDVYEPGAIAAAVAGFAAYPEADVVHGVCIEVSVDGRSRRRWGDEPWDYVENVLRCRCTIDQPAAFFRRAAFERVGGLRKSAVHDFDLWLRLSEAGAVFRAIPTHLATAVNTPGRITNRPALMIPAVVEAIERTIDRPDAPLALRAGRRRARSNAYAHSLYVIRDGQWGWWWHCLRRAIAADPSNARDVLRVAAEIAAREQGVPLAARLPARLALAVRARPLTVLGALAGGVYAVCTLWRRVR